MEKNGQGAIEYLLIIGAAILVVAVVVIALTGVLDAGNDQTSDTDVETSLMALECQKDSTYSPMTSPTQTCCTEFPTEYTATSGTCLPITTA